MIGVGFIGLGGMGLDQTKAFARVKGGKIVAGVDMDAGGRANFAKLYADAKTYSDHRRMLADPAVEAVVIAVPTGFHKTVASAALKAGNGKRLPIFVDITSLRSVTREARLYYRDEASVHATAAAILIGSVVSRVIANFVIGLDKPAVPARLFTSETKAIGWLKGFLK